MTDKDKAILHLSKICLRVMCQGMVIATRTISCACVHVLVTLGAGTNVLVHDE
jgi:hypothetical protein